MPEAVAPVARSAMTVSSTAGAVREETTTVAPSAAHASAMHRPIPRVEPVMTTILPESVVPTTPRSIRPAV